MYIPKQQSFIEITRSACFKQANTRINLRYREKSGGQEHSDFSPCFLMLAISRFQSQLTDFPMYRLEEVELSRHKGMDGKQLLIPLWYNFESTVHAPGSHSCQQSNVVTRSKDQDVPRCTLPR
ncbi:hypothetical protein T08_5714 [Trichinella sp. T8]|nr:hypothetical protein T08_5714 [Trichinella sp. T8]